MARTGRTVPLWTPFDLEIAGRTTLENPFSAELTGVFTGPDGHRLAVPGFYAGEGRWVVRFAPTVPGTWEYRISSAHVEVAQPTGRLRAGARSGLRGGLRVDPRHPHHFVFEDGSRDFLMAYEADWLWALSYGEPEIPEVRRLIDTIRPYGFNQILMNVYAHDTAWCQGKTRDDDYGPPPAFCWEGSNERPDHSRLNTAFFDHLDRVMGYLLESQMTVHLFLRVYNKQVSWPRNGTPEDDLYYRTIVARYQAFPNVIWDFSKEAKNEPDKEYIAGRIALVRSLDAYRRLITVHDDIGYCADEDHLRTMDFLTVQQHDEFYQAALVERLRRNWPVFNSEFGYEHGPAGPEDLTYRVGQSAEELARRAWEVVMAGAYPAYYYTYTAWDVIDQSHVPPGYRYFKNLYDFFSDLAWWEFEPRHAFHREHGRCLTIAGRQYVLYSTRQEANPVYLDFPPDRLAGAEVTWMNVFTGKVIRGRKGIEERAPGDGRYRVTAPFADAPWACHIRLKDR